MNYYPRLCLREEDFQRDKKEPTRHVSKFVGTWQPTNSAVVKACGTEIIGKHVSPHLIIKVATTALLLLKHKFFLARG